jgi:hypothetical protein
MGANFFGQLLSKSISGSKGTCLLRNNRANGSKLRFLSACFSAKASFVWLATCGFGDWFCLIAVPGMELPSNNNVARQSACQFS